MLEGLPLDVITRCGHPASLEDVNRVAASLAKTVVLLHAEGDKEVSSRTRKGLSYGSSESGVYQYPCVSYDMSCVRQSRYLLHSRLLEEDTVWGFQSRAFCFSMFGYNQASAFIHGPQDSTRNPSLPRAGPANKIADSQCCRLLVRTCFWFGLLSLLS